MKFSVLVLKGYCQTGKWKGHIEWLVVQVVAGGMILFATCPSSDTRAGTEAPTPTKEQTD